MKKIVVTGGFGFIGGHLVEEAIARRLSVVIFDNHRLSKEKQAAPYLTHPNVSWVSGSVMEKSRLLKACEGASAVFHLAALVSVPESIEKPQQYVEVNTQGTLNVLQACHEAGVESCVFSSSSAVYGDTPITPKVESLCPEPVSPYGVTKLDGEHYLNFYHKQYGLSATSLRYFNVFGPRQNPNSAYAAVIPAFIHRALANEPLIIYGDGKQTRDFIYVKDVVQANFLAATQKYSGVLNVSYGNALSIEALAELIIKLTNSRSKVIHETPRPGDIQHSVGDNRRLVKALGFKAGFSVEQALKETVAAYANADSLVTSL